MHNPSLHARALGLMTETTDCLVPQPTASGVNRSTGCETACLSPCSYVEWLCCPSQWHCEGEQHIAIGHLDRPPLPYKLVK
jgi:hypothetical protein